MNTKSIKKIIENNKGDLAIIVGNGINRYGANNSDDSWDELLLTLCNQYTILDKTSIPRGIALTEFYDVLELVQDRSSSVRLQQEFCNLMKLWKPKLHHQLLTKWARRNSCPVLTTNFESTLADSIDASLRRLDSRSFTDFYPWGNYYSTEDLSSPIESFAIWHINGMQKYHRSIRLGLTHYMGSVSRARDLIHKGREDRLFAGKNTKHWRGHKTWLHIIFNKSLLIFGLQLGPSEVFLRWLLIERAKYFNTVPGTRKKGWYAYVGVDQTPGQEFFLARVGIETVKIKNYTKLYETPWAQEI